MKMTKKKIKMPPQQQQPGRPVENIMQMQQQQEITGTAMEQGALAQALAGMFQLAGRQIEPTVAGIRSAGQIGAAQASALGQQLAAQASAAGSLGAAQAGAGATLGAAQTRLQGTLAQIVGQMDLQTEKGKQQLAELQESIQGKKDVADIQAAAQNFGAKLQKEATIDAAGKSAAATTTAASKSAEAQKAVAKMNIQGQLGGGQFGDGTIAKTSEAKQAEELQKLQAQLGLGEFETGTIRKQQQEQLEREKALSKETAAQQLGIGDYAKQADGTGGGIIDAQSQAKIKEMQESGRQKLGEGNVLYNADGTAKSVVNEDGTIKSGSDFGASDYASLGEIASSGVEQRLAAQQRQELGAKQMQSHADILDTQQTKIANRLAGLNTPFANMFGIPSNTPVDGGGAAGGDGTGTGAGVAGAIPGLNVTQNIAGAGQIFPQTQALNLLSGASGNPFMQPVTGMAGMTGAANTGPNQLLAMQGAMNNQNQLGMQANQNLSALGLNAAQNLAGSFNQGAATHTQAIQPLASAAGQGLAGVQQAQGQAIANMGGVGAAQV